MENVPAQNPVQSRLMTWLSGCPRVQKGEKPNEFYLESTARRGQITFHDASELCPEEIVELSGWDKAGGENGFYLHFALHSLSFAVGSIEDLFHYLYGPAEKRGEDTRDAEKDIGENKRKDLSACKGDCPAVLRIAFCCSAGWSSALFAEEVQKILDEWGVCARVTSGSTHEIQKLASQNDRILLAPQVGYLLPRFRSLCGDKVDVVETADFATRNFSQIARKLISEAG